MATKKTTKTAAAPQPKKAEKAVITETQIKVEPKEAKYPSAKGKYLVVIPYRASDAQGCELQMAVYGWQKHFKEEHIIVVVGEDDPQILGVVFVKSSRVAAKEGQYRQHLDYVSCFKKVRAAFPESEGFIFTADDVYAVHDFDIIDVKVLKYQGEDITARADSDNAWQRDKAKGKAVLLAENYPTRNFTTHLPQWYDWGKLAKIWDKYDMENESYLMEDLYFNIFYGDRKMHFVGDIGVDPFYKCGIYRPNPRMSIVEAAFKDRIWIQNSPEGWIPELERLLKEHYR